MAQEKILIAEADLSLSQLLKTRLEAMGYLVRCVRTGHEALSLLKNEWFDLVLTSVVLQGGMSGYQLFKQIKKNKEFARIPIAVQSSKSAMREMFEQMGVKAFFIKPYSICAFLGEVKDILSKKMLVLGENKKIVGRIAQDLSVYNYPVDGITNLNKFYINVASYRYCLILIQHRLYGIYVANRLVALVRESRRNKDTPVVIFTTKSQVEMDRYEKRRVRLVKDRCERWGRCEFMNKGYSSRQLLRLADRFMSSG